MIDLHTHTNASDGRCTAEELVARSAAAGVSVLSVTDHDTVAACEPAAAACLRAGIEFVTGIEVTATADEIDVHVLGYFVDPRSQGLLAFLAEQRRHRVVRVQEILERLVRHGITLDREAIVQPGLTDAQAIGRPTIARALVAGGHVPDTRDAFDRWLARGRPAFVPRRGPSPDEVIARIHRAGGVTSLAHPALLRHDDWIPRYASAGLDALEAYHADHTPDDTSRYLAIASGLKLVVTGGSDYHGDGSHGGAPGSASLPSEHYERLKGLRAASRATASGAVTSS